MRRVVDDGAGDDVVAALGHGDEDGQEQWRHDGELHQGLATAALIRAPVHADTIVSLIVPSQSGPIVPTIGKASA